MKKLLVSVLSVFALVILLSFASATITFSQLTPSELPQTSGSFNIAVFSNESENVILEVLPIISDEKSITFTSNSTSLDNNSSILTINYVIDPDFEFEFGKTYSTILTATGTNLSKTEMTLTFKE